MIIAGVVMRKLRSVSIQPRRKAEAQLMPKLDSLHFIEYTFLDLYGEPQLRISRQIRTHARAHTHTHTHTHSGILLSL